MEPRALISMAVLLNSRPQSFVPAPGAGLRPSLSAGCWGGDRAVPLG